jgi:hypothetical protein
MYVQYFMCTVYVHAESVCMHVCTVCMYVCMYGLFVCMYTYIRRRLIYVVVSGMYAIEVSDPTVKDSMIISFHLAPYKSCRLSTAR